MKRPLKLNFKDINPNKTLVLVVDLQNDFCHPKSALKRKRSKNRQCALAIYKFIEEAKKRGVTVAFTQQIYDESKLTQRQKQYYKKRGSTICCKKNSFGAEYYQYQPPKNRLFIKHNFDIWQIRNFVKFLSFLKGNFENLGQILLNYLRLICFN